MTTPASRRERTLDDSGLPLGARTGAPAGARRVITGFVGLVLQRKSIRPAGAFPVHCDVRG